jgi:hypothetical protein
MAEEIPTDTPIEQEVIETPQADVVETEPVSDGGRTNLQNLYEALKSDKVFSEYVPRDGFDSFVKAYSKPKDIANLYNALKDDSVFSEYLPPTLMGAVEYFGLGKPSAVPSPSVSGGSATRKSGVVQPSSSQPNVDNQFGLGGVAAQVGKETELSKEVNAFGNYEEKQSYFAKVDKAKREIVDNKNSSYVLPNTEEGQRIYKDATGLRYDYLKREADAAQAKMSAALNPIINKDINEKYLTKNDDGFLVPDIEKIDQYAKELARRYNLPEDGFLKEVIYNEAKSTAAFRELEPEVNRRFKKLIQPNLVSTGLIEKSNQEVWKNFTTDEVEQAELDKKVGVLADDLKVKSKADEDAIQYELGKQVSDLDMSYAQIQAKTTQQFETLDNQYKNGLPRDQYEAAFNRIQEASNQSYAIYTDDRLKLFDEGQKALNQISNKYNGQLRRQAEELNNIAREKVNKAALEYQKKYGKNPKLEAEIKKLYEKAYLETVDEKGKQVARYNKDRATELVLKYKQFGGMAAMADRFLRSIDSAAGGSLKGLGTSFGINSLQVYGDFLQGSVTLPEAKTKEWLDLFDPLNLSQVSGQLAGGMAPMIAASAVVGAATRSAPVMYQMAATGAASFFTETADIAGRMHDETFAKTQSVAKANEASEKSWEAQYKIIPLYSFRGLPFINTAGTWIKTLPRVSRVALGAAAELLEEIPQEVTQNINEENIRAGLDPFDDYYKKISEDDWKRLKETAISVAPVALLGGAGQISGPREISNKRLMQQQVNSYAAQAKVNELVGNMQGQWVSQMVAKKGDAFAITTINALFTDGTIDEQTRDQLQEHVATSKKNFEDANTLGLSQSEGVVYDALTQAYLEKKAQYEQAQQNGDDILADNLNADMTNIRNQAKEFAQNKQGDFFVFQFEDGSQKIVTNSNWSSDAEILDLIASDQIAVSAYNENGKALLDSLKPKVEEQKVAQEERKVKKLEDDIEVGDTVDLTPGVEFTESASQAEATTEENVGNVEFNSNAVEFINETRDELLSDIEYYKQIIEEYKPKTIRGKLANALIYKKSEYLGGFKKALSEAEAELNELDTNPIEYFKRKKENNSDEATKQYFQDSIDYLEQNRITPQAQAAPQFEAPTIEAQSTTTQESNKASIEVTDVPTDSSPSLRGNINTPDGRGHFTASVLDDGTAYISDIQIGDFQSDDKSRGKGYGLDVYIQIGKKLKELGYNLESTQWDKHISGISPQALRVWEKLKELGYAKVISQKQNKVYNRETGEEEVKQTNVYEFVSEPTTQSQPTPTTEAQAPVAEEVKATSTIDIKLDSDAKIEARMAEIEGDKSKQGEFDEMEKEMERRERSSVFDVPLSEVSSAIDALNQKEKDKPNGFGAFIEKRDARETKGVADKYLNAEEITDRELKRDFTDAVLGNPDTWYADGLKLRESINEATRRGINLQELIADVEQKFINDGFTLEDAKATIQRRLAPVFNGAEIVQENEPKSIEQQAPQAKEEAQAKVITKADIEKRRQEELDSVKIDTSDFIVNKNRPIAPDVITEPIQANRSILGALNNDFSEKRINEYEALIKKSQTSDKQKSLILTELEKIKINAKYDAELDAVKQVKPATTPTAQSTPKKVELKEQPTPAAKAEPTIFDDLDATNKRTGLKGKVEANKAFREKYGKDAAVAKAISSNFEAIAEELKAKGIFTKIKC